MTGVIFVRAQVDSKFKRTIFISFAAGAGAICASALIVAGVLWYLSQPHKMKPWNATALKAEFHYINVEGDQNTLVFGYYLTNQTDVDYQLPGPAELFLMARAIKSDALSAPQPDVESIEQKLFIPAHQKVSATIHLDVTTGLGKAELSDEGALKRWAAKNLETLNGWVLFDKQNHYQVSFPKGW